MYQCGSDAPYFCFESMVRPRKRQPKKHDHSYFEIYLLDEGTCSYFVENKLYYVERGDFLLTPPNTLHEVKYNEDTYARRVIWCAPQYVPQELLDRLSTPLYIRRGSAISSKIVAAFDQIEQETKHADGYTDQILANCMRLLCYTLIRGFEQCAAAPKGHPYVLHAVRYIREHCDGVVRLSDVASEVAISPEYLSRLFKKRTGFGFSEYLNALRLQKAKKMLREAPRMRITAVAFACGFNDSNYFCERFKQVYGLSPMQYRRGAKKEQGT